MERPKSADTLMARVVTRIGERDYQQKDINLFDSAHRRWLTKHYVWAIANQHSVSIVHI